MALCLSEQQRMEALPATGGAECGPGSAANCSFFSPLPAGDAFQRPAAGQTGQRSTVSNDFRTAVNILETYEREMQSLEGILSEMEENVDSTQ